MTTNSMYDKTKSMQEIKQARKGQWEKGATDPALLKDISDTEADFLVADAETAKFLDDLL